MVGYWEGKRWRHPTKDGRDKVVAGATKIKKGELAEKKTWGWDGVREDRAATTFGEGGILQVGRTDRKVSRRAGIRKLRPSKDKGTKSEPEWTLGI